MADTISTRDILAPFQTVSALNELNDFFLLQANRTVGGDGSQAAVRISAQLVKAYLMNGFSITVNNEGYIVIGGEKTHTKIITELAPRVVAQTRRSVSIAPNVLNKWGKVPSLSITSLRPGPSGYANEYMLEFVASGDNFSLLLPRYVQLCRVGAFRRIKFKLGHRFQFKLRHRFQFKLRPGFGFQLGHNLQP